MNSIAPIQRISRTVEQSARRPRFPEFPVLQRPLVYCDIGARGGIGQPWADLRNVIRCVGFEPDPEEHAQLAKQARAGDRYLQHALYRESATLELKLTRSRGCSSIYEPNAEFLAQFPDAGRFEVEKRIKLEAVSLDELSRRQELPELDFMKIDIQGAELDVLKGGAEILQRSLIGVELEVEFAQMYRGQPLFRDVDAYMTAAGFQLQDLRRNYWKLKGTESSGPLKGQLIFGDALYFRPIESVLQLARGLGGAEAQGKIEAAMIMASGYGYLDYAAQLLDRAEAGRLLPATNAAQWRRSLGRFSRTVRFWRPGRSAMSALFLSLHKLFQSSHGGWATSDAPLGSAKRFGWFQ